LTGRRACGLAAAIDCFFSSARRVVKQIRTQRRRASLWPRNRRRICCCVSVGGHPLATASGEVFQYSTRVNMAVNKIIVESYDLRSSCFPQQRMQSGFSMLFTVNATRSGARLGPCRFGPVVLPWCSEAPAALPLGPAFRGTSARFGALPGPPRFQRRSRGAPVVLLWHSRWPLWCSRGFSTRSGARPGPCHFGPVVLPRCSRPAPVCPRGAHVVLVHGPRPAGSEWFWSRGAPAMLPLWFRWPPWCSRGASARSGARPGPRRCGPVVLPRCSRAAPAGPRGAPASPVASL
jgi:hypothetical protein